MGIIAQPVFFNQGTDFWINRAQLYAVSFCWWDCNIEMTDTGFVLHGIGHIAGFKWVVNFKPEFWDWTSNRYTLSWSLVDAYPVAPDDTIIYFYPAIFCNFVFDPQWGYPIIRMGYNPYVGNIEHVMSMPAGDPDFWRRPAGKLINLPVRRPYLG